MPRTLHKFSVGLIVLAGLLDAGRVWAQSAAGSSERPTVIRMEPGNSTVAPGAAGGRTGRPKVIPVGGAAAAAAPASAAPANDYDFCNRTSYVLQVAVGLGDTSNVITRGWWPLIPGECKVFIKGPLTSGIYYSHARSDFLHLGPIREWGGNTRLCAGKGTFQTSTAPEQPCGPGHSHLNFSRVDTARKPGWRTTLIESNQIKSLEQARTAGLQRLLSDVGLFEGAIDGVAGPKLNEAMARARSALGLPSASAAALQTRLIAEAKRIQQASGLTLCNRADEVLYAAFGIETAGKKKSRGWYMLLPGECQKVVKDPLSEPHVYGFATVDKPQPDTPVGDNWRGAHLFCTKDGEFDFEDSGNCENNGFALTGFSQEATEGRAGHVISFEAPGAASSGD